MRPGETRVTPVLITLFFVQIVAAACAQNPTPRNAPEPEVLWTGPGPGPHAVGYRVEHLFDPSRTFPGTSTNGRPVQLSLWYPASAVDGLPAATWKDYFLSAATEIDFSMPDEARLARHLDEVREAAAKAGADPVRFDELLERRTLAHPDAPVADGPHPLVVFVPGFGAPSFQNTVACEYLASNGFLVASFPSTGPNGREMTHDEAGADAQVGDIAFVMRAVRNLVPVDGDHVGLAGYSWGGLTVTLAAMRGAKVAALVGIDSTLMVKKGHALARSFEGYDPAALTMPVMLMIANARNWKERDVSFFEELSGGDASLLRFHDLKHGDFASIIIRFFVHTMPDERGRDRAPIDRGYATACRYLRVFFDAHLRNDSEGRAFLANTPADNGISANVVSVERR